MRRRGGVDGDLARPLSGDYIVRNGILTSRSAHYRFLSSAASAPSPNHSALPPSLLLPYLYRVLLDVVNPLLHSQLNHRVDPCTPSPCLERVVRQGAKSFSSARARKWDRA